MAVRFNLSGDRFGQRASSIVPKTYATARYATPAVGHLVKQDTTSGFNDGVVQCGASDVPYGMVESVNSTNGTLSVIKLVKSFSLVMECANSATLGHQIQANGTAGTIPIDGVLRDQVKDVASSGVGTIVEIDTGSTPVLIRVEFGS